MPSRKTGQELLRHRATEDAIGGLAPVLRHEVINLRLHGSVVLLDLCMVI